MMQWPTMHNGMQFSTHDSDNDDYSGGGWWHGPGCHGTGDLLTGLHTDTVQWSQFLWYLGQGMELGCYKYYHNVEMKIRPKRCATICEKA